MIITNCSIVTFELPEEQELAIKFKKEHPDWEERNSVVPSFQKTTTYISEEGEFSSAK